MGTSLGTAGPRYNPRGGRRCGPLFDSAQGSGGRVDRAAGLALAAPLAAQSPAGAKPGAKPAPAAPPPFRTALTLDQMRGKQAVVATALGEIVIDLLPEQAPNHVGLFIKTAEAGGFTGTTFHRVVRQGIVQGGDPLTRDPATRARAGTGGLNLLAQEGLAEKHTRGAVSAVIVPGRPDSGGTQFFICIVDQPSLDGKHTVYGRVSDGLLVAQRISEARRRRHRRAGRAGGHHRRDHPRPAGRTPGAVHDRAGGRAGAAPRRARDVAGRHHHRLHARQGARARPQLPAARRAGGLRRHDVPPRGQGLRRPDRAPADPQGAADRGATEAGADAQGRVQRASGTSSAWCRWRGSPSPIRPAPRSSS